MKKKKNEVKVCEKFGTQAIAGKDFDFGRIEIYMIKAIVSRAIDSIIGFT
jgi:hypothetical protein